MAEASERCSPSGYDEEFVSEVEEDLHCLICYSPLKDPVQTRCGHRYCKECLEEHFRRREIQHLPLTCPADRNGLVRDRDVFPDKATERKILSLGIKCSSEGCKWTGELRDKEVHLSSCAYKAVPCHNSNCLVKVQRQHLMSHVSVTCMWRIVSCDHCSESQPQCHMQDHFDQCSQFPVTCPNNCGCSIPRGLISTHLSEDCPLSIIPFLHAHVGCEVEQRMADQILTQLKQHPDTWTRVDTILEFSNNQQTKYFALQILESVIKTRWKVLPSEQCEGIKKYIVGLIIKISSEGDMLEKEKTYIGKLNMILVEILKHEWPKKWPSFIGDIVGASKANESLCQNNMVILKLLSEEVFDFSSGQMTQAKAKHLKDSMCSEFLQIFTLCQFVLGSSQNVTLIGATLETLLRFLNWIPLGYIFETQLNSTLVCKFLNVRMFGNVTLKCLTEIAGIDANQYDEQFVVLFSLTMAQLKQMLPLTINIKDAYANGKDDEQKFIQNLSLFLCTFLKEHGQLVEKKEELHTTLLEALHYLVLISEVEETEIFKICLEYWNAMASDLYRENPFPSSTPLLIGSSQSQTIPPRRQMYLSVLSKVRLTMIARMAKPEEVLVVENDQGEVVREFMKDTDAINLYKNMRETLVYLTHLDYQDTERIMTEKLQNQVNGTEWSWKNLNTLCWAVGSISGAMHEEDEKRFLVTVIKVADK